MDLFRKKPTLDETIFQLRFTGKQIDKMAAKAEKEQKKELNKVKKELSLGKERYEFAQLYAENAIRKKNECLNYMRLSSRLDGVASRLKTAQSMKQVTKDMGAVTNGLDQAMKSMDLEKVAKIMDKFESQFENLDVHASVMENSMGSAMASTTPQDQVQSLIQQVADENGLEISNQLDATPVGSHTLESERAAPSEEEELERRLRAMRGAAQ
uniref:charged multivesicular body protein 1a-like n=1 Tax=Ciona intestinalis TaxID=7719 RepID=UPI000180C27C|nr:charged multivesicular body protein 1a-like [Ciona intestinalis]|eukprot:XP_002127064.1 charged multivesicular body protein 1a-like [Ciona intestinalis]